MIQNQNTKYIIENVSVWSHDQDPKISDVLIQNGLLQLIQPNIKMEAYRISGDGLVLIPSGVDAQVHLRVPGQGQKETADTGLKAALKGGYSAILTMPNTIPTIDTPDILKKAQLEVLPFEKKYGVSVFWSAAITKNLESSQLTSLEELVEAGAIAFTNDGLGVHEDGVMEEAFLRLENLKVPLLQHAEFLGHGGVLAPGPIQKKMGAKPYPADAEWKMVERDLVELRKYPKAKYHVLHVSSRKTLDFVKQAKKENLNVTAEASPHHLFFNTDTISSDNLSFKMNPPIRSKEDQDALWDGLIDGTVDFVATDHAPHEDLKKTGSIEAAAFGTLGLETTLGVLIKAWQDKKISSQRFVQVFSKKPAEFLNLPEGFGEFKVGAPFHGALIDLNAKEKVFSIEDISSLSKNSCFLGQKLPGKLMKAFHGLNIFEFS